MRVMSLKRHAITSAAWALSGSLLERALGFVFFAIVIRHVGVQQVGLVAIAATLVDLTTAISSTGFGERVMRDHNLTRREISTVFWVHMGLSSCMALLLIGGASGIATFYEQPELALVIPVLCVAIVLNAWIVVPSSLLARDFRYQNIAALSVGSTIASGIVALPLALMGAGAWALVAQRLAGSIFYAATVGFMSHWRPTLEFCPRTARDTIAFGLPLLATTTIQALANAILILVGGYVLGPVAAGFLRVAQRLADVLQQVVLFPISRVYMPIFSRIGTDAERRHSAITRIVDTMSIALMFTFGMAAAVAGPLVQIIFGGGWDAAAPLFVILTLVAPSLPLGALLWPVAAVLGQTRYVLYFAMLNVALQCALAACSVPYGMDALTASNAVRAWIMIVPNALFLAHVTGTSMRPVLMLLVAPTLAACAGWGAAQFVPNVSHHTFVHLCSRASVFSVVYLLVLCVIARHRLTRLVRQATEMIPRRANSNL